VAPVYNEPDISSIKYNAGPVYTETLISSTLPEPQSGEGGLLRPAARSCTIIAGAKIIRHGFVYIVQLFLLNVLDPADFGLVRYVTIITGLLCLLNEAGISVAIIQKRSFDESDLRPAYTLCLSFSIFLYAAVFMLSDFASGFFTEPSLRLMLITAAISVPLGATSAIQRALLQRRFMYARLSLFEILSALCGAAVSVVLVFHNAGAWSLIWGTVAYNAVSALLFNLFTPAITPSLRGFKRALPLFLFGLGIVAIRLLDFASAAVDPMVIGKAFGAASLGAYTIAGEILGLPQMAMGVILGAVAVSAFSRIQDDNERLENAFLRLTLAVSAMVTPFIVIVGIMAADVMSLLTIFRHNDAWIVSVPLIRLLAPTMLLSTLAGFPGAVWTAKGRINVQIGWSVTMLVSIVIALFIGAGFGLSGICWALLARAIALFPVVLIISRSVAGFSPVRYLAAVAPSAVCGIAAAGACLLCAYLMPAASAMEHALRLAAAILSGFSVYAGAMYLLFRQHWKNIFNLLGNVWKSTVISPAKKPV
jgi:PST family polysaccharide transporter